ncbi:hemerythrin superfamily protein [Spinactinospora alkalitolerans]|uniref:Hemerythrin superfamily protein n=1 Tax=Spinactinospora alkalitolerans TaxID=687207 RepID=A0A852TYI9_9ACTN|nr:hemerythrin domain-containing protein [Spinactinospora alkalitolerans]NYE48405.1 hemerythrin superfamily protein [Spinactinospora alkalitolerans]
MSQTEQSPDLIGVIVSDHRDVERVFTELEQGDLAPERRKELTDHVITELVRHSVAEEQYMYPAARKALADGDRIADHEVQEHAEAERVMKDLEGLDPGDARFEELLATLIRDIRHHVSDEENDLLPRLREACSQQELAELGQKVLQAKKNAPTRPHPSAPDTPPANRILDPGAGMIDRMRDALTGRHT